MQILKVKVAGKNMKEEIRNHLFEMQDKKYQEFHSGLCPNTENIIGVRVPMLRNYAKNLVKQYSTDKLLKNIGNDYYEEIMLQGMIIGLSKDNLEITLNRIKEFVPKIDNWAVCDVFCGSLKITNKYKKEVWDFIQKYLMSDKEFEIRFGVVMILSYYIDKDYLKQNFEIFNKIKHEGYYVKMAVAWAISICLIKFYNETIEFLNKCNLDTFTYNKSLQKAIESYRIAKEQKDELRKMKK